MQPDSSTCWWALEIRCHPELTSAVLWRLRGPGHRLATVRRSDGDGQTIRAFLERAGVPNAYVSAQVLGLSLDAREHGLSAPEIDLSLVGSWDWPEEMKHVLAPHEVGDRLHVVPPWTTRPANDRIAVRMDPRMGFGGTALHPTTRMCLTALERRLSQVPCPATVTVADIGCGAGILSVAAALLGAKRVYAVDTKAASVAGTMENLKLNGIDEERVVVAQGSVTRLQSMTPTPVDGLLCNIITPVIAALIPRLTQVVRPGTWALFSGIREEELSRLDEALNKHGWRTVHVHHCDGWCCIDAVKVGPAS